MGAGCVATAPRETSRATTIVAVNVLPAPGELRTATCPAIVSARYLVIVRPNPDPPKRGVGGVEPHAQAHVARLSELDRIAAEMRENLLDAVRIADEGIGHVRCHVDGPREPLPVGSGRDRRMQTLDHRLERERRLFERRMATLRDTASHVFLDGMARIGLEADAVPDLREVNRRLDASTGWNAVGVDGFIPAAQFFRCLSRRRFPTTLRVRPRAQLDYLPEPDIFHDVFGHVPLHADPVFADFLQRFGALAASARTPDETTQMARLFWFTVEFGLIRERGQVRIYGSGLISSHGDAANALGPAVERRPFALDAVINQPFEIDRFQDVLFVVEHFDQLFAAVETLTARQRAAA